ncbi:MAG: hypothetical protein JO011_06185 [Ktedonobacteraceae bacterium]|nr:hypothetical protein [Ktedonobacteraceae bacterium]
MPQPRLPQYDDQTDYSQQPPQIPPAYAPQPPLPQNVRKPKRWPWIVAIVVAFFIGVSVVSGVSSGSSQDATTTTTTQTSGSSPAKPTAIPAKPTATPKWTTIQTFSGSGTKKTTTFTVGDDWRVVYTCSGMNVDGFTSDANFIVSIYNSDGSFTDLAAVNTICKAGKTTSDNTEEHQGGNVYLDVGGEGSWTIQVQELK